MAAHVADSPAQVHLLDGALGTELGRRGVATRGGLFSAAALLDGGDLGGFFRRAVSAGASAALINCTPPDGVDLALPAAAASSVPFGGYAHLGEVDAAVPWGRAPDLSAEEYARRALRWIERGATIVGGCCGTGPEHVRAVARAASTHRTSVL